MGYSKAFIHTLVLFYLLTYLPFVIGYFFSFKEHQIGTMYAVMSIFIGIMWFLGIEKKLK